MVARLSPLNIVSVQYLAILDKRRLPVFKTLQNYISKNCEFCPLS